MCSKRCSPFKLAPPIHQALVIAEKQVDQKVWFTVRVIPQQTDIRYVNGVAVGIKAVARQPYSIARRYEDFVQLSQRLHEAFPPLDSTAASSSVRSSSRHVAAGPSIPKLSSHSSSKRIHLLHNHAKRQLQRRTDLEKFLCQLFRLPASIAQSLPVLEFFGQQPHDRRNSKVQLVSVMTDSMPTLEQHSPSTWQRLRARAAAATTTTRHPSTSTTTVMTVSQSCLTTATTTAARAGKKRKPSASSACTFPLPTRAPSASPPAAASPCPQPSLSTATTISSIASMIMPSFSTPRRIASSSTISRSSTTSSRDSMSTCDSQSTTTTPPGSPVVHSAAIKIKVIYDVDNIIVIQVPRTVSMADLRSRIMLKFSLDPATRLPTRDFCLLYNDARSSGTSAASCFSARSDTMTVIADDKDLRTAMDKLWSQHEKVTLRCIAKNNMSTRRRPSLM